MMKTAKNIQRNDRLQRARIAYNWRQYDLAEQLGTTVATVKRWERGYQQPSLYFRIKLCTLFGKSVEELGLDEGALSASMATGDVSESEQASIHSREPEAFWMVPYVRNPHFTGRDVLLEQLTQELALETPSNATSTRRAALTQPQAVKGLGGIGKTQIAVEYAYRAREQDRYTHTFWINAASEEAILTSFQTLAKRLPDFPEKDQRTLIAAVLRWIEQCPQPWLLIVDNADDLALAQPYLPQQGQGSILLTTRATAVGWLANSIEVDQMGMVEGTQFLLHRARHLRATEEEFNEASNVVIILDGFPLALDQAGAYIEETGCSFAEYYRLYEQHRATLLARRGKHALNYPHSVTTTWSLSLHQIAQTHPAAIELLRLCTYLSPDHIPEELLTQGAAYWPPILQEVVVDPLRFNEHLQALLAFSLIKRLAQERFLSLHRLVQVVQLDQMDTQEQRQWAERVVRAVNVLFPGDPKGEVETWSQCLRYLEQAQACDTLIQEYCLSLPAAAALLERVGIYLREQASSSLAEPLFQRALAITEQQFGFQHLQVASPLTNLGELYLQQGKYGQAESCYQQALRIREQALGPGHPQIAMTLNLLGILYRRQGKYRRAESCYQRALHIREQALGPNHSQIAAPLNNLGVLYYLQGKYEQAERFLQRALHIREQVLGPDHYLLAYSLDSLGELNIHQGKYEQAECFLQRALHIREQALGPNHPEVASPLTNLGILSHKQGKYEQAEILLLRATRILEQALGPDHLRVAESLHAQADLSREQGHYEQAESLYQRILSLRQEHLDPMHIDIAETFHDLAHLREIQHQYNEARSFYQQALEIRKQALGAQHPRTMATRMAYRHLLQEMGALAEATVMEESATEIFLVCACGCGRAIDTSKSRGKPRRFFSGACKQRFYRNALHDKRNTGAEPTTIPEGITSEQP
jgi:tetratricopeptide (TPR) repeat protein